MTTAADMVAAAKNRVENLTVEETARELEQGDALLVDVREPGERAQSGSISGAVEAPRGIILHCASGGRSALAAATLQELGYERVAHLDGGFKAWKEAGKPVQEAP